MEENEVIIDQNVDVEGPKTVEVDTITEAVDANDAIFDDNGDVVQHFDRAKNTIYKVKGKENHLGPPRKEEPKKETPPAKAGDKPEADAGKEEEGEKPEGEIEYLNDADYVLKKTGYDKDEVDLGDGPIKIKDLTTEQQLMVVRQEYDLTIEEMSARIQELEGRAPELKFDNPQAQQIVDYLKEGGDIKKLAREILSKDPAAQAKMLSDDDIVKMGLKKEFPEYSDEDIDAEFADIKSKEGAVARRAKALRARMEKEQPDFSNLTKEQQAQRALEVQQAIKQHEDEAAHVKATIEKMDSIAGIPLKPELKKFLISQVVPAKYDEDSEFVKSISSPQKLAELKFWDQYGADLLKKTAEYNYKRGLDEANRDKEKLADEPLRTYQGASTGKKQSKKPQSIDDFPNFEAFLNADGF